jgi:hypothetical protein
MELKTPVKLIHSTIHSRLEAMCFTWINEYMGSGTEDEYRLLECPQLPLEQKKAWAGQHKILRQNGNRVCLSVDTRKSVGWRL